MFTHWPFHCRGRLLSNLSNLSVFYYNRIPSILLWLTKFEFHKTFCERVHIFDPLGNFVGKLTVFVIFQNPDCCKKQKNKPEMISATPMPDLGIGGMICRVLFHQQCQTCLPHLTWMVCEMEGKWLYNCCFVWCSFQYLSKTVHGFFI